jgi:hypothetical protein
MRNKISFHFLFSVLIFSIPSPAAVQFTSTPPPPPPSSITPKRGGTTSNFGSFMDMNMHLAPTSRVHTRRFREKVRERKRKGSRFKKGDKETGGLGGRTGW